MSELFAYRLEGPCAHDGMVPLLEWLMKDDYPDFWERLEMLLTYSQEARNVTHPEADHIFGAWVAGIPEQLDDGMMGSTRIFIAFTYAPLREGHPAVLVSPVELNWMQRSEPIV